MRAPAPQPIAVPDFTPAAKWEKSIANFREVVIGGVKTACLSRAQMTAVMIGECLASRGALRRVPKLVFTTNGHAVALAASDPMFKAQLDVADLNHADGQPVVFASRFTGSPIPERSATTDFIHDAAKAAEIHGLRFYLLGATEEINASCAKRLKSLYPRLKIVGRRNGYFKREDEVAICEEISQLGADVVWVGLGVPFEQEFCVRNRNLLRAGWLVTCGGCFNFVSGDYKRAPAWMQATGLEWLHRLSHEPKRLFWRYAFTNPMAIYFMLLRTRSLPPRVAADAPRLRDTRAIA